MNDLTAKQQQVLEVLRRAGGEYRTPTQIGEACGMGYDRASSWAASALQGLRKKGLVQRGEGPKAGMWAGTEEGHAS